MSAACRGTARRARVPVLHPIESARVVAQELRLHPVGNVCPQGEVALSRFTTDQIPRPENRWTGNNRGGWSNTEFDRLSDAFTVALDPAERMRGIIQMAKIFTEEVPGISLYFNAIPIAFVAELKGPRESVPEADWSWNVHEWDFR